MPDIKHVPADLAVIHKGFSGKEGEGGDQKTSILLGRHLWLTPWLFGLREKGRRNIRVLGNRLFEV
jgi:hypothetical protein